MIAAMFTLKLKNINVCTEVINFSGAVKKSKCMILMFVAY
jgi:hypothetical protein